MMATYGVDPGRVFIGGASAGAIMATVVSATYPDVYSAVGSWAGCNYLCADPTGALGYQRMGAYARVVPSIVFAGTLDYIVNPALSSTQITGLVAMNDLADDGLPNGSVSLIPVAGPHTRHLSRLRPGPNPVLTDNGCRAANANNSPCPAGWFDWHGYPYTVTKFGYASSPRDVVVESWIIHGITHNYSGGNSEGTYVDPFGPDTTGPAWRFFQAHARGRS
jgi:poly(3-hydroxybutyrate) depolymerase